MADSSTLLDLIDSSQSQKEVSANAIFDAVSTGITFGRRARTTVGLTWGYYGGIIIPGGVPTHLPNGTVSLTNNADNFIYATAAGVVTVTTSRPTNWPTDHGSPAAAGPLAAGAVALYEVLVSGGLVQDYIDWRGWWGAAGVAGSQGPQGSPGSQGSQGNQGSQGQQGTQGVQGSAGSGSQGSQGNQGTQGSQGNQGAPGTGSQGPQGFQGTTGNQGSAGVANSPLTTKGDLWGYQSSDARVPVSPIAGYVVTADPTNAAGVSYSGGFSDWMWGSGLDGALHFDGSSVVAGLTPSSSIYTMTGNINATSITIDAGVTIKTQNFQIFCQGIFTLNGTVGAPGNASAGVASGAGGVAITAGVYAASLAGATGSTAVGTQAAAVTNSLGNTNAGPSGNGSSNGNQAPTCTAPTAANGGIGFAYHWGFALAGKSATGGTNTWIAYQGSPGGSSGGGGGTTSSGGGGAAGMLLIAAKILHGSGTINMKGGASTQSTNSNVGGSNGGGGGIVWIVTSSTDYATGSPSILVDVSGGAASNQTGGGAHTNGSAGGVGRKIEIFVRI